MKTHILYFLLMFFIFVKINGYTQQINDTTTWERLSCHDAHYSYKLPFNYHISGECQRLENVSTGYKRKPIWIFSELYRSSQYEFLKEKTSTYKKWTERRATLVFDADGVDGSEQGDSIAKNIHFINSQGTSGTELYIYVSKSIYQKKKGN